MEATLSLYSHPVIAGTPFKNKRRSLLVHRYPETSAHPRFSCIAAAVLASA